MPACEIRTGFFTLEPCRKPATELCSRCLRAACPEHLVPDGSGICVECAAEQREGNQGVAGRRGESGIDGGDDGAWFDLDDVASFFLYRSGHYRSRSYDPGAGPGWDARDHHAFSAGPAVPNDGDWDEADGNEPSVFDS